MKPLIGNQWYTASVASHDIYVNPHITKEALSDAGATFSKLRRKENVMKISYLSTIFDNIWENTNQT